MGRPFIVPLAHGTLPSENLCQCAICETLFCYASDIIRNDYQCHSGQAYFATSLVNVLEGSIVQKHFISGHYLIKEIFCIQCT